MEFRVYRKTALSLVDISDEVLDISGVEKRIHWDFSPVVNKISISVPADMIILESDLIFLYIVDEYRMIYYITKISIDYKEQVKRIEASELIYKLKDFYIGDIKESDWSGWYSPTYDEYCNFNPGNPTHWNEQYIQLKFLITVMVHKTGLIYRAFGGSMDGYFSRVMDCNSGNTMHHIGLLNLGFCLPQMKMIGKQNKGDPNYKGSTLLDVFLNIMKVTNYMWEYRYFEADGNICIYITDRISFTQPTIDENKRYSYSEENKKDYASFHGKVKYYSNIHDYYGTGDPSSEMTEEVYNPQINQDEVKNIKSYSLPNHFVLYHIYQPAHKIYEFGYCSAGKTMLEQWMERVKSLYDGFEKVVRITTDMTYSPDYLKNRYDLKNKTSKIVEYV